MEFDKTRWSCSWNSDQNLHKTLPKMVGPKGVERLWGGTGGARGPRVGNGGSV